MGFESYKLNIMDDNEKQLKRAYELRDFEISHYWKRAQYFWGFLAVIYTGFFLMLIQHHKDKSFPVEYVLIICSVGCIFSLSWYFVNRGSKRWQNHWETVINEFEAKLKIPLYAIENKEKTEFFNAGKFSVSKINIVVSFLVFISWIVLWFLTVCNNTENILPPIFIGVSTVISLLFIYVYGKSSRQS